MRERIEFALIGMVVAASLLAGLLSVLGWIRAG